jgi:hypothetical protein
MGEMRNKTAEQIAVALTPTMRDMLLNGFYSEGSATVVARVGNRTRDALLRRGLIAEDNRWTALGREVAIITRGNADGAIKTVDELHAMALDENARREMDEAAEHQDTAAYRHFARASRNYGGYRNAIEQLHAEALYENDTRSIASNWRPVPDGNPGDLRDIETGVEIRYTVGRWSALCPGWDPKATRKVMRVAVLSSGKTAVLGYAGRVLRPPLREQIAEAWDEAHEEDDRRFCTPISSDPEKWRPTITVEPSPQDWVSVSAHGMSIQRHTPSGVEIRRDTHPFPWVAVFGPQWVAGAKVMRPTGEFGTIDRAMAHALRHTIANALAAKAFAEQLAHEEKGRREQQLTGLPSAARFYANAMVTGRRGERPKPTPAPDSGSLIDAADIVTRAVKRAQYDALRAVAARAYGAYGDPEIALRSVILNAVDDVARELGVPTAGITAPPAASSGPLP